MTGFHDADLEFLSREQDAKMRQRAYGNREDHRRQSEAEWIGRRIVAGVENNEH